MPRQNIRNLEYYQGFRRNLEVVHSAIKDAASVIGLDACTIGPYYMADWRPYKFPMAVIDPTSLKQLRVMKRIAEKVGTDTYRIELPSLYGGPVTLQNVVTGEEQTMPLKEFQNMVMGKIGPNLPDNRKTWDPIAMKDSSSPEPLNEESKKLLLNRRDWLDYMVRSIESDYLTKIDIDTVVFDPVTYQPLLFAESKIKSDKPMRFTITKELGRQMDVPAGLVYFDKRTRLFGMRGFDRPDVDSRDRDQLAAVIQGILHATVPDGSSMQELATTSGRRVC